jgi:hypothetical protein
VSVIRPERWLQIAFAQPAANEPPSDDVRRLERLTHLIDALHLKSQELRELAEQIKAELGGNDE